MSRTVIGMSLNEKELVGIEGLVYEYRRTFDPLGQIADIPDSVVLKRLLGCLAQAVADDRIDMIDFVMGVSKDGK